MNISSTLYDFFVAMFNLNCKLNEFGRLGTVLKIIKNVCKMLLPSFFLVFAQTFPLIKTY